MKNYYYYLILLFVSFSTLQVAAQNSPVIACPDNQMLNSDPGACGATATFLTPVASDPDNPTATITVTQTPIEGGYESGSVFPVGTTTVTFVATDSNGDDNSMCSFEITVVDDEEPVADVATLPTLTDPCSVTLTAPTATDNCDASITGVPDMTGPITSKGTTTITWTYTDDAGNKSTQPQEVTITAAVIPAPLVDPLSPITGYQCSVDTRTLTAPTASDACASTLGSLTGVTPDVILDTQGPHTIIWTYTDGNGNTATQEQVIMIEDMTAPEADANLPASITYECEVTEDEGLPTPSPTDNCTGTILISNDASYPLEQGSTYTVTWTYTDAAEKTNTQTQTVIIADTMAPVPDEGTLDDITAECGVDVNLVDLTVPTANDNCDGPITATTDESQFPISGTDGTSTTITWTYTDAAGKTNTQTQTINFGDTTPPTIDTTLQAITYECEVEKTSLPSPMPTDSCSNVTITNNAPDTITETTLVVWTYKDATDNTSTQNQRIVIADTTAPEPVNEDLDDVTAQCEVNASDLTAPTAADNCDVGMITATTDAEFPIKETTTITWTYIDTTGNPSTQTQKVVIADTMKPVPVATSGLSDIQYQCFVDTDDLTPPTAYDNCDELIMGTTPSLLITDQEMTTVITWTFTDAAGNTATQNQDVIIDDTEGPEFDTNSISDFSKDCEVTLADLTPPTAMDNCSGTNVTITSNAGTLLPLTMQGESATITWTAEDTNGNMNTLEQKVEVADMTAPVPDAENLEDVTGYECEVTLADLTRPTAKDACGGLVIVRVKNDVSFPITKQGPTPTVITWTFDDAYGNQSEQTQNVFIMDMTAPTVTCPEDITVSADPGKCDVIVAFGDAVATDNCAGFSVSQTMGGASGTAFSVGENSIEFTATDAGGSETTCSFTITVEDNEAPVADQATLADINANCEVTSLTTPTATDNCGNVTAVSNATFPIKTSTVVVWTFDDGNGNVITENQNINITDNVAPVISDCPVDSVVTPDDNGDYSVLDYSSIITATDNCTTAEDLVVTQSPDIGYVLKEGAVQTVTVDVADLAGNNSTTCSFEITVDSTLGNADAEFTASRVVLYPNPSSDTVFIKTTNIPLIDAQIYDLSGRLIKTINFEHTQDYKIDVSNLETAQYFLNLNSERGSVFKRFVKN